MPETIRVIKTEQPFTMVPNVMLQQPNMSMKAKGLLSYLLSLPKDWKIYKSELVNHFSDGKDAVNSAFNELIELSYILAIERPKNSGKFDGYDYTVSDFPSRYRCGFTAAEKPDTENPQLIINNNKEVPKGTNVEITSPSEKCRLFIEKFNAIRKSKYQPTDSVCKALNNRLKKYNTAQIFAALRTAMRTEYHRKEKFRYLTPEFILREAKIELYLNTEISKDDSNTTYIPDTTN